MNLAGKQMWLLGIMGGMVAALLTVGVSRAADGAVFVAEGNDVFQGFVGHIAQQVDRDKADFVAAESCTAWFYEQLRKPPSGRVDVYHLSFTDEAHGSHACASQYPGINEARAAFAKSQSTLSLSLTFYQLALVADRDDDERYDAVELRDILDSLNLSRLEREYPLQSLARLNGAFDNVRMAEEFTVLTDSMATLYRKGYRFTNMDQAAMGRVTGAS